MPIVEAIPKNLPRKGNTALHLLLFRDDEGYRSQIEEYILDHSEAKLSHGICPECHKERYPDIAERALGKKNKPG